MRANWSYEDVEEREGLGNSRDDDRLLKSVREWRSIERTKDLFDSKELANASRTD